MRYRMKLAKTPSLPPQSSSAFRYQEIASRLCAQITAGVYQADSRLPSARTLMAQEQVSLTTAVRALRLLEQDGHAYARHRSGYFVRGHSPETRWNGPVSPPEKTLFDGVPVTVNDLVVDMLGQSSVADILPLGSAVLADQLIPQSQLGRILATVARHSAARSAAHASAPGLFELRCGIARIMNARGVLCGPDDIIITAGDGAAIECALRLVAKPGDSILIESPTYFGLLQAIEMAGMKAVEITTHPQTGIDIPQLQCAIHANRNIACVVLNPTLHNPLGYTMACSQRKKVVDWLAMARIPLIEDDVFHDLYAGDEPVFAMKSYDQQGMVLYCSSFSKVLSPGYRVGWCVPGRFYRQMMNDFLGRNLSISSLPQQVIAEFLRKNYYTPHTAKLRMLFATQGHKLVSAIQKHFPAHTHVSKPDGGFIYWIQLAKPIDMSQFYAASLSAGISIAPGSIFHASGQCNTAFRICLGQPWSPSIDRAIAMLGALYTRLCAQQHDP